MINNLVIGSSGFLGKKYKEFAIDFPITKTRVARISSIFK